MQPALMHALLELSCKLRHPYPSRHVRMFSCSVLVHIKTASSHQPSAINCSAVRPAPTLAATFMPNSGFNKIHSETGNHLTTHELIKVCPGVQVKLIPKHSLNTEFRYILKLTVRMIGSTTAVSCFEPDNVDFNFKMGDGNKK